MDNSTHWSYLQVEFDLPGRSLWDVPPLSACALMSIFLPFFSFYSQPHPQINWCLVTCTPVSFCFLWLLSRAVGVVALPLPPGDICHCLETYLAATTGLVDILEARDAAKHPIMTRTACHSKVRSSSKCHQLVPPWRAPFLAGCLSGGASTSHMAPPSLLPQEDCFCV